jgi:uncharacterized membrane protein YqaE (UPF0057 family)
MRNGMVTNDAVVQTFLRGVKTRDCDVNVLLTALDD